MENKEWIICRLCKGNDLVQRLALGEQYVNDFPYGKPKTPLCPLTLMECNNCGLIQLSHTAPQELLYSRNYWYESGVNPRIVEDLKEIAEEVKKYLKPQDVVIDVGANDGTLLSFLPDYLRVGVEPAKNLQDKLNKNCEVIINDFWEDTEIAEKAKVITAIGMFYDTDDPLAFVKKVKENLLPKGVFISQLMTAKQMIENNDIGNICHEHIEYYTYKNLVYLFKQAGLEIFKVEENDINGGSYRLFARHLSHEGSVKHEESEIDWEQFRENIQINKRMTLRFIEEEIKKGKKIYAYGASTKGNVIMQFYNLTTREIKAVADKNSRKYKRKMLTGVPIISEKSARKDADYFLVLPYGFKNTFIERERKWLSKGGKFIFTMPKHEITN